MSLLRTWWRQTSTLQRAWIWATSVIGLVCLSLLAYGSVVTRPPLPGGYAAVAVIAGIPQAGAGYKIVSREEALANGPQVWYGISVDSAIVARTVSFPVVVAPYAVGESVQVDAFKVVDMKPSNDVTGLDFVDLREAVAAYLRERGRPGDSAYADAVARGADGPVTVMWDGVFWIGARLCWPWTVAAVLFVVGPLASTAVGCWLVHRRQRSNRCAACGYSLAGLSISKCPECGLEVAAAG